MVFYWQIDTNVPQNMSPGDTLSALPALLFALYDVRLLSCEFSQDARHVQTLTYTHVYSVCGVTILSYDALINLSTEIMWMWPAFDPYTHMQRKDRIVKIILVTARDLMLAAAAESLIGKSDHVLAFNFKKLKSIEHIIKQYFHLPC